jgi:hypothetical protein
MVHVASETELFQIVGTLHAIGRFPHLLYGGQEQADKDGYDGNDHQELNEREALSQAKRPLWESKKTGHTRYPPGEKI